VLEDLGLSERFEKIFISSEVGCEKPDPEIFRRAVEVMDVAPRRCLHVGDDPDNDWEGATAAGMAVFRVKRPEVTLDTLT
jgi:HAD superfamily hydrolase (TIGR01549 family)